MKPPLLLNNITFISK